MRRSVLAVALAAAVLAPPPGADAQPVPLVAEPAWYRPVEVDGKVFPVARSNFFSQMHFDDGWHDPRFRLIDGRWQLVGVHEGIDIVAEKGVPLLAYMDGTIERVGWTFYSGTRIGLRGEDGRYYLYAHVSETFVSEGQRVEGGELIARVGNSGYGEEGTEDQFIPHLHFGILDTGDEWVNPYPDLVRLYRAAVDAGRAGEDRLAAAAAASDAEGWTAEAEALYTTFGIPLPR